MEDRRIFARIDLKIPLRFLAPKGNIQGEGQTLDVSANGVGFLTKENLPAKTSLEMWLDIPDHREPFYTRGEVVWSRGLPDTTEKRAGVHLEKAELMGLARALWTKRKTSS